MMPPSSALRRFVLSAGREDEKEKSRPRWGTLIRDKDTLSGSSARKRDTYRDPEIRSFDRRGEPLRSSIYAATDRFVGRSSLYDR